MTQGDEPSSRPAGSAAGGVAVAAYGFVVYGLFLLVFLYLIGFVTNADVTVGDVALVSKSIDRAGGDGAATVATLVIDAALLMLFGMQHSLMARPPSSAGGPASSRPVQNDPPTSLPPTRV